jgi:hypothetical protein
LEEEKLKKLLEDLQWRVRATFARVSRYHKLGRGFVKSDLTTFNETEIESINTSLLYSAAVGQRLLLNFMGLMPSTNGEIFKRYTPRKDKCEYLIYYICNFNEVDPNLINSNFKLKKILLEGYKAANDLAHFNRPTEDTTQKICDGAKATVICVKRFVYDELKLEDCLCIKKIDFQNVLPSYFETPSGNIESCEALEKKYFSQIP